MSLLSTMVNHIAGLPDAPESPGLPEGHPDLLSSPTDTPAPQPPVDTPQPALYVSTELDLRRADDAREWPRDALIEGQVYRQLDPEYFAWLRSRMTAAQSAHRSGRLSKVTWDTLCGRFNRLQEQAIQTFGMPALMEAGRTLDPRHYKAPPEPPKNNWLYPSCGAWIFTEPVSAESLAKVNAIREAASALGWSDAQLYQNRGRFGFPMGEDYGLVCFVDGPRRIGEVTSRFIEIIHSSVVGEPSVLRFYNPDAPQPWNRKVDHAHDEHPQETPQNLRQCEQSPAAGTGQGNPEVLLGDAVGQRAGEILRGAAVTGDHPAPAERPHRRNQPTGRDHPAAGQPDSGRRKRADEKKVQSEPTFFGRSS